MEMYGAFAFLAPLYKAAFKINLGIGDVTQIDMAAKYVVYYESVGEIISLVEVYGAYHGFESIAAQVFVYACAVEVSHYVLG